MQCHSKNIAQNSKDSSTSAAAPEPGDVYHAKKDEKKLAPNEACAHYNVQSPRATDNAVKSWLIDSCPKVS